MKALKDFVMQVTFDEVAEVLKKEYPNDWNTANNPTGFELVFMVLQDTEPVSPEDDMKILITRMVDELTNEEYAHVCGFTESDGQTWGLDFTPWGEWLGMEVHPETQTNYSPSEIVAHCLWEMTWNGFTEEQINKKKMELMKRIEKSRKAIE